MAGEFCKRRDERGYGCILADGHAPWPCNFGVRKDAPSDAGGVTKDKTHEERISSLEVAVQRIEAKERAQREADVVPLAARWSTCGEPGCDMEAGHEGMHSVERRAEALAQALGARPTPPGVFPPMGTHPAVGVATVDGKATCPKCPESIGSRATYARVPEHPAPTPAMAAIAKWSTSHPLPHVGAGCWCRMGSACPGHETQWPTPAEAAIFERGGYLPGCACERHTSPPSTPAELRERLKDAERRLYEYDARTTNAPRPPGPIVGLDAMLPPLSPALDRMHCCGSPTPLHYVGCPTARTLAELDAGLRPPCMPEHGIHDAHTPPSSASAATPEKRPLSPCPDCGAPRAWNRDQPQCTRCYGGRTLSPAAMLREAVALGNRIDAIITNLREVAPGVGNSDDVASARARLLESLAALHHAQREAEARESLCDQCAKAETRPDFCMACAAKREGRG